jgi:hypothetical protein
MCFSSWRLLAWRPGAAVVSGRMLPVYCSVLAKVSKVEAVREGQVCRSDGKFD